jgi:uncharacterized membrane protein
MKTKVLFWWDELRERMWFIPSVYSIFAIFVGTAALLVDRSFEFGTESLLPLLETTGASGRIILGALIGALVTVMGLVFSLTMLSVSQTSSQYGPRLIRFVFDSNITQNAIGTILSTVILCMLVLRTIRDNNSNGSLFTPHLSILMCEIAGAICIFVLLAFTNHVTRCMRAETLIQSIYKDLLATAAHLFPEIPKLPDVGEVEKAREADVAVEEPWQALEHAERLEGRRSGYLQAIELEGLLSFAHEQGHRVEILRRAGDFIYEGEDLARIQILADEGDSQKTLEKYQTYFLFGTVRTPRQDIEAGVLELVEAGVRALSPGVNDPMTAISVIDYLSSFLRRLAHRQWPDSVLRDCDGVPRVRVNPISFRSVLDAGFDQLRQYAGGSVAVNCRLLEGLAAIADATQRPDDRHAVGLQLDKILRAAERNISELEDLKDVRERADGVRRAMISSLSKTNMPRPAF